MPQLKKLLKNILGNLYIPDEVLALEGKNVLHVSDTPALLYSDLKKLIEKLKPDYIIHTGDLVDNIKLEMYPNRLKDYRRSLKKLGAIFEHSAASVYIALGNHDHLQSVKEIFPTAVVFSGPEHLEIEGVDFGISHYPPKPESDGHEAFYLFGHDLTALSEKTEHGTYLNALEHIYIIELETKNIISLNYPTGTNDSRLNKGKLGI